MNRIDFEILLERIGFKDTDSGYCVYKEYRIILFNYDYDFYDGYKWNEEIPYNDLTHINKYFKKYFRSIKLKKILR